MTNVFHFLGEYFSNDSYSAIQLTIDCTSQEYLYCLETIGLDASQLAKGRSLDSRPVLTENLHLRWKLRSYTTETIFFH